MKFAYLLHSPHDQIYIASISSSNCLYCSFILQNIPPMRREICYLVVRMWLCCARRVLSGRRLLSDACTLVRLVRQLWRMLISWVSPWVLLKIWQRQSCLKFYSFSSRLVLYWFIFWFIISIDLFFIISYNLPCSLFTRYIIVPFFSTNCLCDSFWYTRSSIRYSLSSISSNSVGIDRFTRQSFNSYPLYWQTFDIFTPSLLLPSFYSCSCFTRSRI